MAHRKCHWESIFSPHKLHASIDTNMAVNRELLGENKINSWLIDFMSELTEIAGFKTSLKSPLTCKTINEGMPIRSATIGKSLLVLKFLSIMLIILILNINAIGNFHLLFHPNNETYLSPFFFFFFLRCFNNLKFSDLKYLETVKSFDSLFLDRMSVSIPLMTPPHLILYVKTITRPPHYLHSLSLFLESHLYVTKRKKKSTAGSSHGIDWLLTVWSNEKLKNESLEKFIAYLNFKLLTKVKTHTPKTELYQPIGTLLFLSK